MHLLPAYEAGGEEEGSLVVKGYDQYDHMHLLPMVRRRLLIHQDFQLYLLRVVI